MINRSRLAVSGVLAALAVAGCGSSGGSPQTLVTSVTTQPTSVTTQPATVESVGFGSPEVLVENLIAAIERGDVVALESALPSESWQEVGSRLMEFVPSPGDPPCPEVTGTTAKCYIWDDYPQVLEIEAVSGAGGWVVTRAVLESTN